MSDFLPTRLENVRRALAERENPPDALLLTDPPGQHRLRFGLHWVHGLCSDHAGRSPVPDRFSLHAARPDGVPGL